MNYQVTASWVQKINERESKPLDHSIVLAADTAVQAANLYCEAHKPPPRANLEIVCMGAEPEPAAEAPDGPDELPELEAADETEPDGGDDAASGPSSGPKSSASSEASPAESESGEAEAEPEPPTASRKGRAR